MRRYTIPILALAMTLSAGAAQAEGWYIGAFGSYSQADDIRFATALGTVKTTFDSANGLGIFVGYDLGSVRLEGEWSNRDYDVKDHILDGTKLPGPTGSGESSTFMLNAYYDFNSEGTVQPYIGAGLGYTDLELDRFGVTPVPDVLEDDDSGFSYQLLAGLGFELSDSIALFVDYRYQSTTDLGVTVSEAAGSLSSKTDWDVQDLAVGLRFTF